MQTRRSAEETRRAYHRAIERIKRGESAFSAGKAEGLSASTFYKYRRTENGNKTPGDTPLKATRKYTARRESSFVDVPLKTSTHSKVAVIVCQPEDLKEVLAGLQ